MQCYSINIRDGYHCRNFIHLRENGDYVLQLYLYCMQVFVRLAIQVETVISVQQVSMVMVQHVHLVATKRLHPQVELQQKMIVRFVNSYSNFGDNSSNEKLC